MTVRRLRLGDGERIRALRLDALSDAPYAFGSSFDREVEYSPEYWDALAEQSEAGERGVVQQRRQIQALHRIANRRLT